MDERHLDPETFDRLMRDELSAREARELVWHLLDSCPTCAETVEIDWTLGRDVPTEAALVSADLVPADPSFDAAWERAQNAVERMERESSDAEALLGQIEGQPAERVAIVVRNSGRLHSAPLCERLLAMAWRTGFEDPVDAEVLAALAIEVAEGLEQDFYGRELVADLEACAWAYRGNFRRMRSDFLAADEAFQTAHELLGSGTGDLLERARVLDLESSLRRAQRRSGEAEVLLDRAISLYLGLGEEHRAGRALINRARLHSESGDFRRSIEVLKQALELVDVSIEPRLLLCGQQNLVDDLYEMGLHEEAMALLPKTRRLSVDFGTRMDLLRFRFLEGRILLGLGHENRAEAAFLEVRKGFLELDAALETAQVSLELAGLYLRQGRTGEIKGLMAEVLPIFQSRQVHREVLASLMLLQKAIRMDTVSLRMVEEVAGVLRRIQDDPRGHLQAPVLA